MREPTPLRPELREMSDQRIRRTLELLVRKPIMRAGVQDRIERAFAEELERRKVA